MSSKPKRTFQTSIFSLLWRFLKPFIWQQIKILKHLGLLTIEIAKPLIVLFFYALEYYVFPALACIIMGYSAYYVSQTSGVLFLMELALRGFLKLCLKIGKLLLPADTEISIQFSATVEAIIGLFDYPIHIHIISFFILWCTLLVL